MATETADNGNAKGTTVSTLGPAFTVAATSGSKAKTRRYTGRKGHITSRYLKPRIGSCHDRCKNGVRDEPPELKKPGRRLGVRKISVKRVKIKRFVEPVERKKTAKTKPKPIPRSKTRACDESTIRKSTLNELKLPKNHVKPKPSSSLILNSSQKGKKELKNMKNTGIVGKCKSTGSSSPRKHKPETPRKDEGSKTKAKIKQLLAEKITEITLKEAENEELEFVTPTLETNESTLKAVTKTKLNLLIDEKITEKTSQDPKNAEESPIKDEEKTNMKELIAKKITDMTLQEAENAELESVYPTVTAELTNLPRSKSSLSSLDKQVSEEEHESSRSSSDKQVSEKEHENSKPSLNKQISEEKREYTNNEEVKVSEDDDKMVNSEEKENEGSKGKFMRKQVKVESADDGHRKLIIGKGKIPKDEDDGPTRLKFRRGKIVEGNEDDGPTRLNFRNGKILEDEEDDGPTRLNFRKGKTLEDSEDDGSITKMKFKKTVVEEATEEGKKESETVTLKHQEMQEKKEAQELLNRVIKETASKLEVDRKNKVEALVGAFETVISLHDDTTSSQ